MVAVVGSPGPLGPPGPPRAPRGCFFQPRLLGPAAFLAGAFFFPQNRDLGGNTWPRWGKPRIQIPEIELLGNCWSKNGPKKVEFEGVGPIWRDPRRNLASNPGTDVQNGWMATQLVTKRCDLGSLGVPGPASTPLGLVWQSHSVPVWQSHRACGRQAASGGRSRQL